MGEGDGQRGKQDKNNGLSWRAHNKEGEFGSRNDLFELGLKTKL